MTTPLSPDSYARTRQAWRDIWAATGFERELATLSYPRARALLRLYMPHLPKESPILEAGCGYAQIVYYLRQHGYNVIGLDYAPEGLTPTADQYPELPLHLGDVHQLPYADNSFGGYLSFGVVEHFEAGPAAAIAEAYRVLRPGGLLVLTVPHPNFVEDLVKLADRLFPARVARRPRAEYYETNFRHAQIADFVRAAGFVQLSAHPYSHSYTFYGLGGPFRGEGYYVTSGLAEACGRLGKRLLPWYTAFECLILARKPAS
jgi:SAM-dependent methyltransferase